MQLNNLFKMLSFNIDSFIYNSVPTYDVTRGA